MDINKLKNYNNGFYYYKTDEFATIDLRLFFNYENTKENHIKSSILSKYLQKTNSIYKTPKDISDKSKELYGLNVSAKIKDYGIKRFMCFELKMVNPRIIEEDFFSESINFLSDIILKPNFENNSLDKETISIIKKELIDTNKDEIKNPIYMNERLFYKNVMPNSNINNSNFTDSDEYENIINSITDTDIINFYNELLNNYICSFAFGDLTDEEIKIINNTFNFKQIDFDYKYDIKDSVIDSDIEILSKDTTQSNIYFVYEIKDYKKDNTYLYDTLCTILCNNNGPIHNIYRTKLGIMYSGFASIFRNRGIFFIKIDIDKKNKEKAIDGLKELFNILHDKNEMCRLLEFAKERRKENIISISENINSIINELEEYVLKNNKTSEEKLKLIEVLTVDDIINQIDNLEYKCMFFYKGDKNEK